MIFLGLGSGMIISVLFLGFDCGDFYMSVDFFRIWFQKSIYFFIAYSSGMNVLYLIKGGHHTKKIF